KVAKEDDRYLVSLFQVNKLNTLFSELISQQLNNLVNVPGRHVIFNLEGIRFIDSAGFGVLMKASEISSAVGSSFQLCNISAEVQELIDLTELNGSLSILPKLEVKEKIIMELDD
ncbi:MAG: STAS domain-containing protein, partial [Bacteroidales bacterium]|nr:STAS domain-containing protein [Bacteroidales bacterium]